MESRRLTVFALLALCAAAGARPGTGDNDIQQVDKPPVDTNKEVVHSKQEDDKPGLKVIEANQETVTTQVIAAEADAKPVEGGGDDHASNATVKSVNERFPHAVLFGGTCGGTIISPKWILSAGHCTLFSNGRSVLAGTDRSWDDSGVSRRVKRLVIHPLFSVGPYWLNVDHYNIRQVAAHWDFLLVELTEPLPLNGKTMVAAELDDQPTVPEGLPVGYGGYGAEHHGDTMRHEMHGMEMQVLADSKCRDALEQYDPKDMICTQGLPPRYDSACNGDSGSGLVADGKVYGVASWVQDDAHRCFSGALVVFSRVGPVRDWIRQVTKI